MNITGNTINNNISPDILGLSGQSKHAGGIGGQNFH